MRAICILMLGSVLSACATQRAPRMTYTQTHVEAMAYEVTRIGVIEIPDIVSRGDSVVWYAMIANADSIEYTVRPIQPVSVLQRAAGVRSYYIYYKGALLTYNVRFQGNFLMPHDAERGRYELYVKAWRWVDREKVSATPRIAKFRVR